MGNVDVYGNRMGNKKGCYGGRSVINWGCAWYVRIWGGALCESVLCVCVCVAVCVCVYIMVLPLLRSACMRM